MGLPGSWVVLFLRAEVVHPAGCGGPSPISIAGAPLLPSGETAPSASGMVISFVAAVPRPTRSRIYASPSTLPCPSQDSLPAGAVFPFAGRVSHPLDDLPNFTNSSHSSLLSDQPFLVALIRLCAATPNAWPRLVLSVWSGPSATPTTTPWLRPSSALFKTEVIERRGPWRSFDAVEYATLEWVDWFNRRRLLEPLGYLPPFEFEQMYYRHEHPAAVAGLK